MQLRFNRDAYHDRCQVETVVSMLKRRQGSYTSGRSHHSRCRDLYLMVLTHNAMILVLLRVFYRAGCQPFQNAFSDFYMPAGGSCFALARS